MDPGKFFENNLKHIEEVIKSICTRKGIYGEDAKDFASHVKIQLIENDYQKIREFRGKSNIKTYLNTVITRIYIDMKRKEQGRWRPSEAAKRVGNVGVILEELINKHGHSFEEAYEILTTNHNISISKDEAYALYCKLPEKTASGMSIDKGDEPLSTISDQALRPTEVLINRELNEKKARLLEIIEKIRPDLSPEDRLLLKMVFEDNRKISEIARLFKKERNEIDRRLKQILAKFKEGMLARGININDVMEVIEFLNRSGE